MLKLVPSQSAQQRAALAMEEALVVAQIVSLKHLFAWTLGS